jgi:hypothetical protein
MRTKSALVSFCMTAFVLAFTASGSWATLDCSWQRQVGTGVNATTIAVASNFVTTAEDLIANCQSSGNCPNTHYTICSDSTANLRTALDNDYVDGTGFATYGYFFAADTSATNYNSSAGYTGTGTAYSYVKGIPVMFAYASAKPSVTDLLTCSPALSSSTIGVAALNYCTVNTNITGSYKVSVAASGAPYGVKAHAILNAMYPLYNSGSYLPTVIPSWVVSPLASNIAYAFSAVNTSTVPAGFVSKAQICSTNGNVDPQYTYVEFTNSSYTLDQKAILLRTATNDPAADYLNSYIRTTLWGADWTSFVTSHCYYAP